MNRIQNEIETQKIRFSKMETPKELIDEIVSLLNFSLGEWRRFQEMKTAAVEIGILTPDEGDTISQYISNSLEEFNNQPPEIKVTMTQIFEELHKT